ncbi:MAG: PIN domain-containing protein, partial [Proteobacteria bacterium]|nr:PIN domain-containing protein [Pseudomonadota bacterium]
MLKYMLDTNILIYTIKNRPAQVKKSFKQHAGQMCISSISVGELVFGAEHSRQVERNLADIEMMIAHLEVLPFGMLSNKDKFSHAYRRNTHLTCMLLKG